MSLSSSTSLILLSVVENVRPLFRTVISARVSLWFDKLWIIECLLIFSISGMSFCFLKRAYCRLLCLELPLMRRVPSKLLCGCFLRGRVWVPNGSLKNFGQH